MNEYTSFGKKTLLFVLSIILISATTQAGNPENKEQTIDVGNYMFLAPPGDNWKVEIEKEKGSVSFSKQPRGFFGGKLPLTTIHVRENRVLQEKWNLSEEETANDVREREKIGMFMKGGLSGDYFLTDSKNDTITIDGKKIYIMSYKNSGGKLFGKDKILEAILHLYFPPDFKEKQIFYMVIIAEIHEIGKTKETDFTLVYPVINSLRSK